MLSELLKGVYLEMAEHEIEAERGTATASRLSLRTGLHRKDVKRLREAPAPEPGVPPAVSLGSRLVARWLEDSELRGAEGRPRPLPRSDPAGGPSFEALVASVSTDIRPRAVLDEWLRLGVVELDVEGRVALRVDAFVPRAGFEEKAHYLGRNLHDHAAAAAENLAGEAPPMLERSVHYEGLSAEAVEELEGLAEEHGMAALRVLNRRARALQRRDARRGTGDRRMNFGVYFYRGAPADPEAGDDG